MKHFIPRLQASLTTKEVIDKLGIGTNLQFCLDSADANSYASGQKWLDVSGNGQDFFLGVDATTSRDPAFVGTSGARTSGEYFEVDFDDSNPDTSEIFQYDTTTETWMQNIHKDNAAFSFMFWVYGSRSINGTILAYTALTTGIAGGDTGFFFGRSGHFPPFTTESLSLFITNNGTTVRSAGAFVGTIPENQWVCLGVALDEATGANGVSLFRNGGISSLTSTYVSPAAGNASLPFRLMRIGADSRIAIACAWSRRLTNTEMLNFYNYTRPRFGV